MGLSRTIARTAGLAGLFMDCAGKCSNPTGPCEPRWRARDARISWVLTCGTYGSMLRLPPLPGITDHLLTGGPEILTIAAGEHQ